MAQRSRQMRVCSGEVEKLGKEIIYFIMVKVPFFTLTKGENNNTVGKVGWSFRLRNNPIIIIIKIIIIPLPQTTKVLLKLLRVTLFVLSRFASRLESRIETKKPRKGLERK